MKSVRPRLAVHADARAVTAAVAECFIELRGAGLRIKVYDEEAMIGTVLIRVENNARAGEIGCDPVRLLTGIKRNPAHFARLLGVRNIQHGQAVGLRHSCQPPVPDAKRYATVTSRKAVYKAKRRIIAVHAAHQVKPTIKRMHQQALAVIE